MLEALSRDPPVPLQHMEVHAEAPVDHGGLHAGAGGFPKEAVTPCEAWGGAGSW